MKILIAIGGTGGHVFPGCNLAYHLAEQNYNIKLVTDSRGYKFCKNFKDLNITVLPSSPLMTKNCSANSDWCMRKAPAVPAGSLSTSTLMFSEDFE